MSQQETWRSPVATCVLGGRDRWGTFARPRCRACPWDLSTPLKLDSLATRIPSSASIGTMRAAALQARSRAGLESASARHSSNVATDTPISWDTRDISALSDGSSRATARTLKSLLYRATVTHQCPKITEVSRQQLR